MTLVYLEFEVTEVILLLPSLKSEVMVVINDHMALFAKYVSPFMMPVYLEKLP